MDCNLKILISIFKLFPRVSKNSILTAVVWFLFANRPFSLWRHLTGLLLRSIGITKFKCERKNEMNYSSCNEVKPYKKVVFN